MLDEQDDTDLIETPDVEADAEAVEVEEPETEQSDELVVSIDGGDEPDDEEQSSAITKIRQSNRDLLKKVKQLEAEKRANTAPMAVELGPKPKIEQFDYDPDKFETALLSWNDKKRDADAQAEAAKAKRLAEDQEWNGKLNAYREGAVNLGAKDFADAEDTVKETLSGAQQGIIVHAAQNAPLVVYALGQNPKKAAELAKITDPILFAVAVTRLEMNMKVSGMKTTPAPEKRVTGKATMPLGSRLAKLEAEAERTGDRTAVLAEKRRIKALQT